MRVLISWSGIGKIQNVRSWCFASLGFAAAYIMQVGMDLIKTVLYLCTV
jgi:hypothetical protein